MIHKFIPPPHTHSNAAQPVPRSVAVIAVYCWVELVRIFNSVPVVQPLNVQIVNAVATVVTVPSKFLNALKSPVSALSVVGLLN